MEELNYSIEKWKLIGVLEDIPEERHENAVNVLNTTLKFINELSLTSPKENFETAPIMVMIRILRELDISTEQAIEIIKEFKQTVKNPPLEDVFSLLFDWGLQYISTYSDFKIKELQKNNINN